MNRTTLLRVCGALLAAASLFSACCAGLGISALRGELAYEAHSLEQESLRTDAVAELLQSARDAEAALSESRAALDGAREEQARIENEIRSLKQEKRDAQKASFPLRAEYESLKAELEESKRAYVESASEYSALQGVYGAALAALEGGSAQYSEDRLFLAQNQSAYAAAVLSPEGADADLVAEYGEASARVSSYEKNRSDLDAMLSELSAMRASLESTPRLIAENEEKLESVSGELEALGDEEAELDERLGEKNAELREAQEGVSALEADIASLESVQAEAQSAESALRARPELALYISAGDDAVSAARAYISDRYGSAREACVRAEAVFAGIAVAAVLCLASAVFCALDRRPCELFSALGLACSVAAIIFGAIRGAFDGRVLPLAGAIAAAAACAGAIAVRIVCGRAKAKE